jgi:hypothetical protein
VVLLFYSSIRILAITCIKLLPRGYLFCVGHPTFIYLRNVGSEARKFRRPIVIAVGLKMQEELWALREFLCTASCKPLSLSGLLTNCPGHFNVLRNFSCVNQSLRSILLITTDTLLHVINHVYVTFLIRRQNLSLGISARTRLNRAVMLELWFPNNIFWHTGVLKAPSCL